ncbi:hypothetical protein CC79DRAFT_484280 [Sarocladium strictum]
MQVMHAACSMIRALRQRLLTCPSTFESRFCHAPKSAVSSSSRVLESHGVLDGALRRKRAAIDPRLAFQCTRIRLFAFVIGADRAAEPLEVSVLKSSKSFTRMDRPYSIRLSVNSSGGLSAHDSESHRLRWPDLVRSSYVHLVLSSLGRP